MRAEVRQAGRIVPFLLLCMGNAGMARVEPPRTLSRGIDRLLAESYPEDAPGVTVIVTRHGKTVYSGARGLADVDRQLRLKPDSILRYASISKQFTAAMILKLTQDGKLALDASASQYLPPCPAAKGVTVRQLLNHTSGIRSYTDIPGAVSVESTGRVWTTHSLIALFCNQKPDAGAATSAKPAKTTAVMVTSVRLKFWPDQGGPDLPPPPCRWVRSGSSTGDRLGKVRAGLRSVKLQSAVALCNFTERSDCL